MERMEGASKSPHPAPAVQCAARVPEVDVQTLLGASNEVRLICRGVEYRLRITRQGKLLLTK